MNSGCETVKEGVLPRKSYQRNAEYVWKAVGLVYSGGEKSLDKVFCECGGKFLQVEK